MNILIGNLKGGVGTTTHATNIAVKRASIGRSVFLIDTSTLLNADMWCTARSEKHPSKAEIVGGPKFGTGVSGHIQQLARHYDDVVIDAGGSETEEFRLALTQCQLLLVPFRSSQFDLWVVKRMATLIEEAQKINPLLKARAFLNLVSTNPSSRDIDEARDLFSSVNLQLPLITPKIGDRIAFRRASAEGLGITEYKGKDNKALTEFEGFYAEAFPS